MDPTQDPTATNSVAYYVSFASSALLVISEALPYVTKIKANGIIQALVQAFGKYDQDKQAQQNAQQQTLQAIVDRLDAVVAILQSQKNENNKQT